MLEVNPSSTGQLMYLTLKEAVKHFTTSFSDYLMILTAEDKQDSFALIPVVVVDNGRYTELSIDTNSDDVLNGKILAANSGQYHYQIYGQNSVTNLDPTDAVVVGLLEQGLLVINDTATAFTEHDITLEDIKYHTP